MSKRTRDWLIMGAFVVIALLVTVRFGRSLPENQPDNQGRIESLVGDWAVVRVEVGTGASEFPDGLPSIQFDGDGSWDSTTECAILSGTVSFDGVDPIGPGDQGSITFNDLGVEGLTEVDCDDAELLTEAMLAAQRWAWEGQGMVVSSNDESIVLELSPVL